MLKTIKSIALVASLTLAHSASAAVVAYTDYNTWLSAVSAAGPTTNQAFNGNASSFAANSTGNVIGSRTTVDLDGGLFDTGPTGLDGSGSFRGEVDSSSKTLSDGLGLNFNFDSGVSGFGLRNFRTAPSAFDNSLSLNEIGISVAGTSYLLSDLLGLTNSSDGNFVNQTTTTNGVFVGFVSDTDLTGFSLIHGDFVAPGFVSGGNEEFLIGSLRLAGPVPSTVPVPAALPMLLAGLAAFGAMGWRRKRALAG
ncbi:VPLPA-CTERM sorting domain-containing protein [Yoonia sp. 208BN28-4]|uniref:VPLPA-CTERM sorting domain-containing protein n=1 Tax=Yoonia sp. 208BN28-4 TaxID=3126505 RepID=UPI0030AF6EC1